MEDILINKVAQSGLITLDLEKYFPNKADIVEWDMKDYLFMELILKEKNFRDALKEKDWTDYVDKIVAIHCSADAIIPLWAYMLVTTYLQPVAREVLFGTQAEISEKILQRNLELLDTTPYADQRIVVKGCGDQTIPASAYITITRLLRPIAKSIMYGEPCSTVPVYKKPKL